MGEKERGSWGTESVDVRNERELVRSVRGRSPGNVDDDGWFSERGEWVYICTEGGGSRRRT